MEPRDNSASRSEFAFVLSLSLSQFFPYLFWTEENGKGSGEGKGREV